LLSGSNGSGGLDWLAVATSNRPDIQFAIPEALYASRGWPAGRAHLSAPLQRRKSVVTLTARRRRRRRHFKEGGAVDGRAVERARSLGECGVVTAVVVVDA